MHRGFEMSHPHVVDMLLFVNISITTFCQFFLLIHRFNVHILKGVYSIKFIIDLG